MAAPEKSSNEAMRGEALWKAAQMRLPEDKAGRRTRFLGPTIVYEDEGSETSLSPASQSSYSSAFVNRHVRSTREVTRSMAYSVDRMDKLKYHDRMEGGAKIHRKTNSIEAGSCPNKSQI